MPVTVSDADLGFFLPRVVATSRNLKGLMPPGGHLENSTSPASWEAPSLTFQKALTQDSAKSFMHTHFGSPATPKHGTLSYFMRGNQGP